MLQEISRQLCEQSAAGKEDLIKTAICNAIGHDEWKIDDLKGRLRSETTNSHDGVEVFYLDNKKLIAFFPIKFSQEEKNGSFVITAKQNYKIF